MYTFGVRSWFAPQCRYEKHTHHRLELFGTFYQDSRIEFFKCKFIFENDLVSHHEQSKKGLRSLLNEIFGR